MYTIPQIADAVNAAPMPLQLKEQILDQVLGHHDDLSRPRRLRRAKTPMSVRVDAARLIGAFDYRRTTRAGVDIYTYCKDGSPAYELHVRDGRPVHCGCDDFAFESALDPGYSCKHMRLFLEDALGGETLSEGEVEDLISEAAHAAGEFERAWAMNMLGRLPDEACNAAYARFDSARSAMRWAIAAQGPLGDQARPGDQGRGRDGKGAAQ